jgi:DNA-binding PadR family transcriptional regulator
VAETAPHHLPGVADQGARLEFLRVRDRQTTLSPGEWAVLGLIAEQPRHGFALRKALSPDGEIGRVWSLPGPLVYRALTTLQSKGLAAVAGAERSDVGPQRTLVTPTEAGRAALQAWLWQPVEHLRDFRSLFMLKLALLDRAGERPQALLVAQMERVAPIVAALEEQADTSAGFDRALATWRLESARAAERFLDQLAGHSS